MPNHRKVRAFTLVEILVVISIIALLAALLQPTLVAAKKASFKASCSSNLRQTGMTFSLYGGDNDDRYPAAADQYWIDHSDSWSIPNGIKVGDIPNLLDVLAPYAHDAEIFRCPSDHLAEERVVSETVVGTYPSRFAYDRTSNYFFVPQFFGKPQTLYPSSFFVVGRDFDPRWHCDYLDPLFPTPAYNILFGDGHVRFGSLQLVAVSLTTALTSP